MKLKTAVNKSFKQIKIVKFRNTENVTRYADEACSDKIKLHWSVKSTFRHEKKNMRKSEQSSKSPNIVNFC